MTQFINNSEINTLLFSGQRTAFTSPSEKARVLSFEDCTGKALLAQFYLATDASPNIIFFPSTKTPLEQYEGMAASYNQQGINVLILSYRSDNGSNDCLTLEQFYQDGRQLFDQASNWLKDNSCTGTLFVMGQALGSILAIDTAFKHSEAIKGLLLESAISQTGEYLKSLGVTTDSIDGLEENGFRNLEKIEKIKLPTLIFHGARDPLIPIAEAEKLQATSGARSKQFFIIPGAQHDNLYLIGGPLYFETIKKFIDTLCGVNTWRQKRRKYNESQES
ncbi:alpha/beta hydrolase [Desulforhopalus sp. IMCC35007]|uniref:alpha/beta hydrolase n=1 Tax=Desulforhopalus sp. IMCC35007 TaxID=2569543 RepID=UPI0010AE5317|nr:alpha/beta hydrolase [Desulforhopalus sp. IMCC35007]TKB11119.1 alpha/beta hydrolase [Desulforhopalus sp. IMCC35007]